jgi:hypothetical protein
MCVVEGGKEVLVYLDSRKGQVAVNPEHVAIVDPGDTIGQCNICINGQVWVQVAEPFTEVVSKLNGEGYATSGGGKAIEH